MNIEQLMKELTEKFPNVWLKPGSDFRKGALIWSGEDSYIDNEPAFDYWAHDPAESTYVMSVHKKLHEWALSHQCYWECYDPGTFLLYKI